MPFVHSTALVHPEAKLAENVEVGPYCVIEKGVLLESGVKLQSHVVIKEGTTLHGDNQVDAFTSLGGIPQDFSYVPGAPSFLEIGEGTLIREGVIIHGSTRPDRPTRIGIHAYIMNQTHIGHDVQIGDHVVISGGAMFAGFSTVGNYAVIGGKAAIHQWVRIGEGTMLGGMARLSMDVPPFTIATERNELSGLNLVGMKRRKVPRESIAELKSCFMKTIRKGGNIKNIAEQLLTENHYQTPEARRFLHFLTEKGRPFAQFRSKSNQVRSESSQDETFTKDV